ncbi:MAG: MarR family transcriptional regulator [Arthrobacter sp.]|jgi:DNA-binding MarR family transcriptional regulator|nr:MarR family transcriptional regulator [Arthrobacter sp.]
MSQRTLSPSELHRQAVAAYVAAGADEPVQRVITALQGVNRSLERWYTLQLRELELSQGEWGIIAETARAGEPLTPGHLAQLGHVAPSSMTHRLDKLEERGLIRRAVDENNRTRVLVELTQAGRELFGRAIRESDVVEAQVLQDLGDEERLELARMLEVVIRRLDQES